MRYKFASFEELSYPFASRKRIQSYKWLHLGIFYSNAFLKYSILEQFSTHNPYFVISRHIFDLEQIRCCFYYLLINVSFNCSIFVQFSSQKIISCDINWIMPLFSWVDRVHHFLSNNKAISMIYFWSLDSCHASPTHDDWLLICY